MGGGMVPGAPAPMAPSPQGPAPQGPMPPNPQGQAGMAPGAQGIQTYFANQPAVTDTSAIQSQIDQTIAQMNMAQVYGAPPNVMAGLQSQLASLQRQLQEQTQRNQMLMNKRMAEERLGRFDALSRGSGPVGGRPVDQTSVARQRGNLEDALLAAMLGGGGGRTYYGPNQ